MKILLIGFQPEDREVTARQYFESLGHTVLILQHVDNALESLNHGLVVDMVIIYQVCGGLKDRKSKALYRTHCVKFFDSFRVLPEGGEACAKKSRLRIKTIMVLEKTHFNLAGVGQDNGVDVVVNFNTLNCLTGSEYLKE